MKRWSWLVVMLVVWWPGRAFAKEYKVQKTAGDYTVGITMDKDPPVVGMNHVEVMIKDKAGKAVTDAKVVVTASMPAMPGMPAMTNKGEAKIEGTKYKAMIDISMAGSWNMSVQVIHGGKTVTTKFTVDAR